MGDGQQPDSIEAFLTPRECNEGNATVRYQTKARGPNAPNEEYEGDKFAAIVDERTPEQDEFKQLAQCMCAGKDSDEEVKIQELLTRTFVLHFEITIYNVQRKHLQAIVKAMTQAMWYSM